MLFKESGSSFFISGSNQLDILVSNMDGFLLPDEIERLKRYKDRWNMYEGYHWEGIPEEDKPQTTKNYVRRFADKLNYFLFGKEFVITVPSEMENLTLPFLNNIWDADHNNRKLICQAMGQSGGVCGDAYVGVSLQKPGSFYDPFNEYPKGRIKITVYPPQICFPRYNLEDREVMDSFTLRYPIELTDDSPHFSTKKSRTLFSRGHKVKQRTAMKLISWTNKTITEYIDDNIISEIPNKDGIIPFVHIPNIPILTSNFGISDIEDIIPINRELNFRASDIAEVIDYHGAPVTVIFGAKVSSLERGANKVWSGLPKDAKVENLSLEGDLEAAIGYYNLLKQAMHEIGAIPETSLGAERAISNTSGVALHLENLPLIEKSHWKIASYGAGIKKINRLILYIAVKNGMIRIPDKVVGLYGHNSAGYDVNNDLKNFVDVNKSGADIRLDSSESDVTEREELITDPQRIRSMFYDVGTKFYNVLPKDELQEIEKIRSEVEMGIESRVGAMKRLGKENIQRKLEEIREERRRLLEEEKELISTEKLLGDGRRTTKKLPIRVVSGFNNGPEPKPQNRVDRG